jgi:endoglucanase
MHQARTRHISKTVVAALVTAAGVLGAWAYDPPAAPDLGPRYRAHWESGYCIAFSAREPDSMVALTNPASYAIECEGKAVTVTSTGLEVRLIDLRPGTWPHAPIRAFIVYLNLARRPDGHHPVTCTWRPAGVTVALPARATVAVQCLQLDSIGYEPASAAKTARMGGWCGTAGALDFHGYTNHFEVIRSSDGECIFEGVPELLAAQDPDSGACVYRLDFSAVTAPGEYRLRVPGVGWSIPFQIGRDVHAPVRWALLRALYHQRCGTAIGPPYTQHAHAACHTSMAKLVTFYGSLDDVMKHLTNKVARPTRLIDGRGGWHDAGDYDRAGWHIFVVMSLLDAYSMAPEMFGDDSGIPESGNGIPDILDEARWGLAWFARMQDPEDGGLWYRVETVHYGHGLPECDHQQLYAMAKYPKYTTFYAAGAAQAARVLEPYISSNECAELLARARQAFTYGTAHDAPREAVSRAAAELFLSTGDGTYHTNFLRSGAMASWSYATSTRGDVDPAAQAACRETILAAADGCVTQMHRHAYPFCGRVGAASGLAAAKCVRAFVLTGRDAYLEVARTLVHAQLGMNALRRSWVTGLGVDPPEEVTHAPSTWSGRVVPGLPIFGPLPAQGPPRATHARVMWEAAAPKPYPWMRLYAPIWEIPGVSEFTVRDIAETVVAYTGLAPTAPDVRK